ncbi:histidine kinase [Neisseriaceae bacterium ESL0693]|nr:histidine kinase [Neisseriaceae bacterium ESL0693]
MKRIWQRIEQSCLQGKKLSQILMVFIALWLILASMLIGLSLNTSWRLEERGMAINEAGSLRKRVFHIALLARQPEPEVALQTEYEAFESVIRHLKSLREGGFDRRGQHDLMTRKLDEIERHFHSFWYQARQFHQHKIKETAFIAEAEAFTQSINDLVLIIESDNTRNIRLLRWFQFSLLLMAWVSAFASLRLLHQLVLLPLYRLNKGIDHIREKQFYTRLNEQGTSEFGQVVHGFNLMASRLSDVYDNLEGLVAEKTHALRKKNYELAMLYEMTSIFQENQEQSDLIKVFLDRMMAFSGAKACVVQLKKRHATDFEVVGSSGLPESVLVHMQRHRCGCGACEQFGGDADRSGLPAERACEGNGCHLLGFCQAFPIKSAKEEIGILNLFAPVPLALTIDDKQLIETVAGQFGIAIERLRLNQLDTQMAVLEERNLMARGLHDSIAQSLSFLNMQVQVLLRAIKDDKPQLVQQTLNFIDEGIKECYADVRELLSNFRVRLAREGFLSAMQSVIVRFEKQTSIPVDWSLEGEPFELDDDEQLQVIFIVQEALSNIRKHARATQVQIKVVYDADRLCLRIQDNGVGFDPASLVQKELQGHVGTSIMRERAGKIDGQLQIVSAPRAGTTVELTLYRAHTVN